MRISSSYSYIGIKEEIVFGNGKDINQWIIKRDIERFLFGILYIFIGLFSSVLYFRRKLNEYLAFGILSLSTGFFYISSRVTGIQHLLFYSDTFWLYLAISSLSLIPVGIFWLLYHLLIKTKRIILLLLRIHIIYFISVLLMFFFLPIYISMLFFYPISFVSLLFGIVMLIYESLKGNREARIIIFSITINLLAAIHDILRNFSLLPYDILLGPRAFFILIMSIVYILERRFSEIHKKLELYSRDLELAKDKLEEKVEERTRELKKSLRKVQTLKYAQDGDYFSAIPALQGIDR
ncbi:MAG: hypothetical protein H7A25_12965 [Leptospiraceae bacterium]|nr:hypothetical protein [Leptospiraceae bacterium]